jgi:hypothetical protein
MSDQRPDRVYGVLVREGTVFLSAHDGQFGLPGGVFRPLAEDRKVELKAHLEEQLGIRASAVWAQGAFDYQHPVEREPLFSGFYSVWEWTGTAPDSAGCWLNEEEITWLPGLPGSLRILLISVLQTVAMRTR